MKPRAAFSRRGSVAPVTPPIDGGGTTPAGGAVNVANPAGTFSPVLAVIDHTPADIACDAAEAAYKRALGGGNSRATVERLRRAWIMAKARTLGDI